MKHSFNAKIYQTGINWCVDAPKELTAKMTAEKGKIKIKGFINGFKFGKTLMPVKNASHRLFVNKIMMNGAQTALGEIAHFEIEQDHEKVIIDYPMPELLIEELAKHCLTKDFDLLTKSRKKDILKYLNYIKTPKTLMKNIDKLILQLKQKSENIRIP